jgi:hypothetical protein
LILPPKIKIKIKLSKRLNLLKRKSLIIQFKMKIKMKKKKIIKRLKRSKILLQKRGLRMPV